MEKWNQRDNRQTNKKLRPSLTMEGREDMPCFIQWRWKLRSTPHPEAWGHFAPKMLNLLILHHQEELFALINVESRPTDTDTGEFANETENVPSSHPRISQTPVVTVPGAFQGFTKHLRKVSTVRGSSKQANTGTKETYKRREQIIIWPTLREIKNIATVKWN